MTYIVRKINSYIRKGNSTLALRTLAENEDILPRETVEILKHRIREIGS